MDKIRPCECGCFYYEHHPLLYAAVMTDKDFGSCLICDDCMQFKRMDNLKWLEYEAAKKTL